MLNIQTQISLYIGSRGARCGTNFYRLFKSTNFLINLPSLLLFILSNSYLPNQRLARGQFPSPCLAWPTLIPVVTIYFKCKLMGISHLFESSNQVEDLQVHPHLYSGSSTSTNQMVFLKQFTNGGSCFHIFYSLP